MSVRPLAEPRPIRKQANGVTGKHDDKVLKRKKSGFIVEDSFLKFCFLFSVRIEVYIFFHFTMFLKRFV